MDHNVIWISNTKQKIFGLTVQGMDQICHTLNQDDTALIINENLRVRYTKWGFEIYNRQSDMSIFRFDIDDKTSKFDENDECHVKIIDDLWLRVEYYKDNYPYPNQYRFTIYKLVTEIPKVINQLTETQRKIYNSLREFYQECFLKLDIIPMTEDQITDDLYVKELEYNDKQLKCIKYILKGYDKKHLPIEVKIKPQLEIKNKDTDKFIITQQGESIKEWLKNEKNRRNLSALSLVPFILFELGTNDLFNIDAKIIIILLDEK
ncbi:MAG: hypothetical protein ACD_33C00002G0003 [uncultured bacterium]|nr:MAG: hypothetical protein ACD_33C00002G0003 [uncultured bacterium]